MTYPTLRYSHPSFDNLASQYGLDGLKVKKYAENNHLSPVDAFHAWLSFLWFVSPGTVVLLSKLRKFDTSKLKFKQPVSKCGSKILLPESRLWCIDYNTGGFEVAVVSELLNKHVTPQQYSKLELYYKNAVCTGDFPIDAVNFIQRENCIIWLHVMIRKKLAQLKHNTH